MKTIIFTIILLAQDISGSPFGHGRASGILSNGNNPKHSGSDIKNPGVVSKNSDNPESDVKNPELDANNPWSEIKNPGVDSKNSKDPESDAKNLEFDTSKPGLDSKNPVNPKVDSNNKRFKRFNRDSFDGYWNRRGAAMLKFSELLSYNTMPRNRNYWILLD